MPKCSFKFLVGNKSFGDVCWTYTLYDLPNLFIFGFKYICFITSNLIGLNRNNEPLTLWAFPITALTIGDTLFQYFSFVDNHISLVLILCKLSPFDDSHRQISLCNPGDLSLSLIKIKLTECHKCTTLNKKSYYFSLRAIQSWFYTIVFMLHMENP